MLLDFIYKKSISTRLLKSIFGFYSIIAIFVTVAQIYLEFQNLKQDIKNDMNKIEESFSLPLKDAIWNVNAKSINGILQGIRNYPVVTGVVVTDEFKQPLGSLGVIPEEGKKEGFFQTSFFVEKELMYSDSDEIGEKVVGRVVIYSSNKIVIQKLQYGIFLVILNALVKTSFLLLIMLFFMRKYFMKPLTSLTSEIQKFDERNLRHLNTEFQEENELSFLKEAFNELVGILTKAMGSLEEKNQELKNYQNHLEDMVTLRTRELEKAKKEAELANGFKSQFLANMGHEFRTPLNAILGFTQLSAKGEESPVKKEYYESIKSSCKSLLTLINDILDFSKVEAGELNLQFEAFDSNKFFEELPKIFFNKLQEKGLDLLVETSPYLPPVMISDEVRLRQIITNLISNSIKFTERGHVKIIVNAQALDENTFEMSVEVEDTGVGIPEEELQYIFGVFQQRSGQNFSRYGGTGLGLSIVKQLTELLGGTIEVKSELNKGSTFKVSFNRIMIGKTGDLINDAEKNYNNLVFDPARVLIVDDNEKNLTIFKGYLEEFDFEILLATNGEDSVKIAKSSEPNLILMDIRMPGMNGIDAMKLIRELPNGKDIKIVAVTATTSREWLRGHVGVFDNYLFKPVHREVLLDCLVELLPYQCLKDNEGEVNPCFETFSIEEEFFKGRVTGIYQQFCHSFLVKIQALQEELIFNDAEVLGQEFLHFGKELKIKEISNIGREMEDAAKAFDLEKLKFQMKNLDLFLEKFKSMGRNEAS